MKTIGALVVSSAIILLSSCRQRATLFTKISSAHSGIHFANNIVENDSVNPIELTNIYNGGGVGVGDFNRDGLQDLYFTGNQVPNKLYLNKGNFKFEDVTDVANVNGAGEWCRGATVVDINNDGWPDIYVSASILPDPHKRQNLLYINQGADKNGVPHFKEMAAEYGLNDTTHTTMAAFFDYDNDGDLDVYLVVNQIIKGNNPSIFRPIITDGSFPSTGKLYRNDWDSTLKHPVFTDVTKQAGVTTEGYGHGVNICDINRDGWKDIFVTNDFISNDLLYINNHDGTFTNKATSYFKHTSANGMGQDVIDINNDGLSDVVELDMDPEDNYRKKTMLGSANYYTYQKSDYFGYQYQYVRNSLQLNMGSRVNGNDSVGDPVFGDVGFMAGISETDWSWTPLVADFDNDGYRDIIVTNGFPRDVTDHDFIAFRRESSTIASEDYVLSQIPQVKLHNYAFQNKGNVHFDNATESWGLTVPSFSNGAVYADLDNDGDMDMVVNNINDEAFVYENTINAKNKTTANYLEIKFRGDNRNIDGLGAWAEIYFNKNEKQFYENSPYRGYLSTIESGAFFGLGNVPVIDSVIIRWPGNKKQKLTNVKVNQTLLVDIKNASLPDSWTHDAITNSALFTDVTTSSGINYSHEEKDYIDFDRERLLPHKLSQYGPGLAAGDVDGNGLDDIFIGGSTDYPGTFFLQQSNGKFERKHLPLMAPNAVRCENMGLLLFDADNDGDLDLYCTSGSDEFPANTKSYQDQLFVNNGKGDFVMDSSALPLNYTSKSCVKAVDFDNDGDLDLFVGGRCMPGKYPLPVTSFIYRNDSKKGQIKFTDVTNEIAPSLKNIGMVCDAIWTDFDNDGWTDLIVVGEWMPITFLKNNHGKLENVTAQSGVSNQIGWWNSIVAGDFDNDGDIDYIVGNLGQNSFLRASDKYPVSVYAKDFDNNGSVDAIVTLFLKDKKGVKKEYTAMNRDDIVSQLPGVRKQFLTYKAFADADVHQIFPEGQMKGVLISHANNFKSCFLKNEGNGKFELHPLPDAAQISSLNGMVVDDFNNDGNLDVAISGNDYGNEVFNGRYDAMNGLVLLGDGNGNFAPQTILQSGVFIPGDAKALIKLRGQNNNYLLAASQNRGPLKIFTHKKSTEKFVLLGQKDKDVFLTLANGKKRKEEVYFGNSFLSQCSRFINVDENVRSIEIKSSDGTTRRINL
ncbi:MAG: RNA-binding protein [Bacteroidetes bacterium]|nr:MAG: RNA-binding protein [Bacteroidota bacterium]